MKYSILFWFGLIVFFISTSILAVNTGEIFNSPDERANFLFAQNFAEDQVIAFTEPLNLIVGGTIHPRSMISIGSQILPGSFLGFPIFSGIVGMINSNLILFVTPFLAVCALLAWRQIILKVFKEERLANISTILLAVHPAFWYYTARTMMHNIGFISLLIIGVWFLIIQPWKQFKDKIGVIDMILGGILIGLALAFRTSEILWVGAGFLVMCFYAFKSKILSIPEIIIIVLFVVLSLLPFAFLNKWLYGGVVQTGYTAIQIQSSTIVEQTSFLSRIFDLLFPFGIHEMNILQNVVDYGFLLYPWMSILAILGSVLVLIWFKKEDMSWKVWTIIVFILSIWLVVIYGSWSFNDNPDPLALTIGNSYARYWLPIFVLSSPLMAKGVLWLADIRYRKVSQGIIISIISISIILSGYVVFFTQDGLFLTRKTLESFDEKKVLILDYTEDNSVIVVDMADKYLFPERRVITPLRSDDTYENLSNVIEEVPVYYFGITLPDKDIDYLNTTILGSNRVSIESIVSIKDETLYRFILR